MDTSLKRICEKVNEQTLCNFHFHYNFVSSECKVENYINKISEKELDRLSSVWVCSIEYQNFLKTQLRKKLLILSGKRGMGRVATSINLLYISGSSKIYYGEIHSPAEKFIEEFEYNKDCAYVFKINELVSFQDSFIKKIKNKLDEAKSKLIVIVENDENSEISEKSLFKEYYIELQTEIEEKVKKEIFENHFDYEMKIRANLKICDKVKLLTESPEFLAILKSATPKDIYYITKRLISRILRNYELEDLIKGIERTSNKTIAGNFATLEMDDKLYSIAVAVLEKQPYQFLSAKISSLSDIMKDFYPPVKEEKKEYLDEGGEDEEKEEKFEYWKYNTKYIKRLYKDHLKKIAKNKIEKKEEKKEEKNYFEIYQRSSKLDRINASLYFGQFENEFGMVQKEYVRFTENNHSKLLLKHVLDEYYPWRVPILTWMLSIKFIDVSDYETFYQKLEFISSIIEEDFVYLENIIKLKIKDDFENNFKIAFIICSIYMRDKKKQFIINILKKWASSDEEILKIIALIAFLMIPEKKFIEDMLFEFQKDLKDEKKENHEEILLHILWIFKFAANNTLESSVHKVLVKFLHEIIVDDSYKKYDSLFRTIVAYLFKSSIAYEGDTKPYFVYLFLKPDFNDKVLKIIENYIFFSSEMEKALEDIKEILKKTDEFPDSYEYTEILFNEIARYNKGSIFEQLKFYLNKWKNESITAEKILSKLNGNNVNLNKG